MCMHMNRIDRSFWKELDDNLIYYQNGENSLSPLRIRNIQADRSMHYKNIPKTFKTLRLLNKHNSYLNVFIETQRQTIIAKLDRNNQQLRINYRICQESLFHKGPIYDFSHNILLILQNGRLVQMFRNKFIRKYKGNQQQIVGHNILTRMGLRSFNLLRKENYDLFCQLRSNFEKQFNISIQDIHKTQGRHIFKKVGDFLILKKHFRHQLNQEQILVYYLSIDNGRKGKFYLNHNENLKRIKCFNNVLYVIISQSGLYQVYEIKGEQEKECIYQANKEILKKPILQQQYMIYTNKLNGFITFKHKIKLIRNQIEIE